MNLSDLDRLKWEKTELQMLVATCKKCLSQYADPKHWENGKFAQLAEGWHLAQNMILTIEEFERGEDWRPPGRQQ